MSFAEFLSSMGSGYPPPPPHQRNTDQRNTDLTRRPTLHRRELDLSARRGNRSRSVRPTTGGVQANESGNPWDDSQRGTSIPSTTFTRRPLRRNSEDGLNSSRSRPWGSRQRSFHSSSTSSSGSSSRLRRGGVQPPEIMATRAGIERTHSSNFLSGRQDLPPSGILDARDEFLTSLPTPRSTSPDVNEDRM